MSKLRSATLALAALLLAGPALAATWTGWITDEHCGAAGAKAGHKDCALKCMKEGKALVFYDSADKKIYKLSSQDAAKEQLGHEVVLTGTLDGDTIQVESIEAAEPES